MRFLGGGLWSHFSNVRDFLSGAGRDRFGSRADEFGFGGVFVGAKLGRRHPPRGRGLLASSDSQRV
jgi:hypothetical protein